MPKHLEFNRDGFKFSLTGDAVTIWDYVNESKISQTIYQSISEAETAFKALYRTFCERW